MTTLAQRLRARREDGYTLVELLAASFVLVLLFSAFSMTFSATVRHGTEATEQSALQGEVRSGVERLARDLRQSYTDVSCASAIETMTSTQIQFLSPDAATPFHLRRISYRLSGGQLQRATAVSSDTDGTPWVIPSLGSWVSLAGSIVSSSIFTYLDANGAVTATAANVRTVVINVVFATTTSSSRQFTYQTSVTLRTIA